MTLQLRSKRMAHSAYLRVASHGRAADEYVTLAKKFPALVHSCGLAQAVSFALAKSAASGTEVNIERQYLEDLTAVLAGYDYAFESSSQLVAATQTDQLFAYLRVSRDVLAAAGWLKRYVETLIEEIA